MWACVLIGFAPMAIRTHWRTRLPPRLPSEHTGDGLKQGPPRMDPWMADMPIEMHLWSAKMNTSPGGQDLHQTNPGGNKPLRWRSAARELKVGGKGERCRRRRRDGEGWPVGVSPRARSPLGAQIGTGFSVWGMDYRGDILAVCFSCGLRSKPNEIPGQSQNPYSVALQEQWAI